MTPSVTPVPPVIDAYFARLNADDWETFAALWTDDAELHAVGFPPCLGKEAVLAYYPAVLGHYRSHHDAVERVITAGDTVTVEIHFTGTTNEGRPVKFDAVDVFDLRHGRIVRLSSWYDTALVGRMVRGEAPTRTPDGRGR